MKCNQDEQVVQLLADLGVGFDCASKVRNLNLSRAKGVSFLVSENDLCAFCKIGCFKAKSKGESPVTA